jgi:hypothetical protein
MVMPPPMVPAPITPTLAILRVGVSSGHVGDLRGGALAGEGVAQGARFGRAHHLDEVAALDLHAFVEGLGHGGLHRVDALEGRREGTGDAPGHVARELEVGFLVGVVDPDVAHALERALLGHHLVGEGQRALEQVAFDEFVEQRRALELLGGHRVARQDQVQRRLDADDARHALRAAGAGQQAQLDFRQGDRGAGDGDAEVRAQRQFQAAAHADAADRGDDGLGTGLDDADHGQQVGFGIGLGRTEFADVGAARKGAVGADQDHGLHQTSSHSLRTASFARRSSGVPSNTIWPCPIT